MGGKLAVMDFTGMKPSDALEKAHEAFPEIKWEWTRPRVHMFGSTANCCCAAGLLCLASGVDSHDGLAEVFPSIDSAGSAISQATYDAHSFPEAIELLRARGW